MSDTKEKLVEILRQTRYEYRRYIGMKDMEKRMARTEEEFLAIDDSIVGEIPFCADHLIVNGVTVQRWIPVTERLPESGKCVLVCSKDGMVAEGSYKAYEKKWTQFRWNVTDLQNVTHWMPLPEPPKGE